MANPIALRVFVVAGTIIIAGVVFAIVRSRFDDKQPDEGLGNHR
jgi:hypothetical protein